MSKIETAKMTLASISGAGFNAVAATGSAAGLSNLTLELGQTQQFLYLNIPIWMFFCAALLLSMFGSFASLFIDLMREANITRAQMALNLVLGFFSGVIGAFVILPAVTAAPVMPIMMLTALILSFVGTVLVRNLGDIIRDEQLAAIIKDFVLGSVLEVLTILKDIVISRLKALLSLFLGGSGK